MGGWFSSNSEDTTVVKTVDASGVSNNFVIQSSDPIDVESIEIVVPLYIMCGIHIILFIIWMHNRWRNNIKKKLRAANQTTSPMA